jgi:hypothetical protein
MVADQFQRNGVILDQRFCCFGMATPVLSVEEEAAALLASLKSLQQARPGWSTEKGEPSARGHRLPPFTGPSPPLLPDLPSPTLPAQGGEAAGERCSTIVWVAKFSEPRGPVPAQRRHARSAFRVFGMTTPVLSVGEERGGFTGIFEIVAAGKPGVVG